MNFSMLIANNNRSKSYLQNLVRYSLIPEFVILLDDKITLLPEQKKTSHLNGVSQFFKLNDSIYFDESESLYETLEKHHIPFEVFSTTNPNDKNIVDAVSKAPSEWIIYSGPGGTILQNEILSQGKYYIHIHPGKMPEYRGSTTFYYSYLLDDIIICSATILDRQLDFGPLLYEKQFSDLNFLLNIDTVIDPLIRASTLIDYLMKNPEVKINSRPELKGNVFFIVHPVIKHLSILKMRNESAN